LAPLLCTTHTKTITKRDSGAKEYPRAAQIALHIEIMRSNFSFDATFYAIHMPNMKKRGKLRAKTHLSLVRELQKTGTCSMLEELHNVFDA
jgi:hypothetical protein